MPRLHDIRQRLREAAVAVTPRSREGSQAAVAVLLRERGARTEMLFIKRAERAGDPWSGHMAFPGGRAEPGDVDLLATAIRETREEIGIDLRRDGEFIAPLPVTRAQPRASAISLTVAPFVFEIAGDPVVDPNHEVADVVWTPMMPMIDGACLTTYPWRGIDGRSTFPGYAVDKGYIVWGLTYRMLHTLFETVRPHWEPHPT